MITVAIGDLHGMAQKLEALLDIIDGWCHAHRPDEPRHLIFLGDYVDRGPQSREVLDRVRALQREGAICLRGNHEALMIGSLDSNVALQTFLQNGGDRTIASLATVAAFRDAVAWMRTLPLYFEDDLRFFVHAGIRPGVPLDRQSEQDLLWIREPFLNHPGPFHKFIIHGHSPTVRLPGHSPRAHVLPHRCNLDTGAVYGGPLSAGVFTDEQAPPIAILSTADAVASWPAR
jgi:serine/threonine protein phosphatase 1